MLNKIIAFSIRNKLIVGILVLALVIFGIYNLKKLPIDAVPDITNNQVLVITPSPSLGAADIERLITFPVEQATINIPGITEQRSFSRFGLSIVTIVFDDNTDVYWARQQVSERLLQVQDQIPPSLGVPFMGPVTTGLGEIFQYVVKPKPGYEGKYDAMELRTIQDWIIRRQLLTTPGVADVSSFGGKLKQYEIGVNYDKLKSYNLTISDIFSALEKNNQNTGGAYIEKGPTALFIRSEGLVKNTDDINSILIKRLPDGTPVSIAHVADVKLGTATRYGAVCYNDEGEVAGAVVMMLKGANSSAVIKNVKDKITQIEKVLPEGVTIEPFLDRTKMVNNAISTVERNLVEGALIVVLVLVIFLGNLRAGLLVASVIPLSMFFAIIMMNLFGVSGNLMSLGALDFGLIIDGAVIIVEAVMHRLHHNKHFQGLVKINQQQMDEEVNHSAGKMMNAAVFGQIIILIVYLPILSLQGIEGKMFKPMAQTVAFAIAGAFLLSLTYIPMMSALVLSKKISIKKNIADRIMAWLEKVYKWSLEFAIKIPKLMIASSAAMFILAVFIMTTLGGEFIPKLEEGDFAVDTRVLTGSSIPTTIKSTQQAAHILLTRFPEVEEVVTKIGSGEIPTDPMPIEASDMMVVLKPKKEWTSAGSFDALAEKMSKALEDVPGITAGFQFPVQMRFNELMTGGRQDVICKIFGEDIDTLAAYAEKLGNIAATVDGAKDIYVETVTGLPQIVVNYNRAALTEYGLSVTDVNNTIQSAFAGAVSGQVFENERRFDLVVRLNNDSRQDLKDVQNLLIATPSGEQVPLQQVADVQIKVGPNQIQRENAQRRITVGFNVRGKDIQTVVKELQDKIGKNIKMPPAYYITYGGQFENLVAAKKRLSIAVPVSLLLIFLMLYLAFNSMKQGLLIFSAIPLSAIGGVFALWIRGMPFSISAGIGFIALFGVAVLNGIVLITEFNQLKEAGVTHVRERVLKGTRIRLRPVLMTAAVASLGFMPMALSNGAGAEVQRPLATVVIGGLITATLLTLLLLPVLYMLTEKDGGGTRIKFPSLKKSSKMKSVILILFSGAALNATAQQTISLHAALDTVMKQHPAVTAAKLKTLAAKNAEGSAYDIAPATVTAEYGQVNSYYKDSKFSLSQTVSFPVVYKRQKEVYKAVTETHLLNESQVKLELKKQVTSLYYQMLVLQEKEQLLQQTDSMYSIFLQKQEQRLKAGDANILEKTAAESQLQQVRNQRSQLQEDYKVLQTQFAVLLNTTVQYRPEKTAPQFSLQSEPAVAAAAAMPVLKIKAQEQQVAVKEVEYLKARNLPQLSAGYTNQSFVGVQNINGADKYYNGSSRFSAGMLGLNIPIFNKANKSRIAAGRITVTALQSEYEALLAQQRSVLQTLLLKKDKHAGLLEYYTKTALPQAKIINDNVSLQLANGAISYLEWIMLTNQTISIKAEYINAISEWNTTAIELNSYLNN
ncbi:MAG: CusA/CzcA family heavy metal efflux RND transporter [Ferruginibacter sp.]